MRAGPGLGCSYQDEPVDRAHAGIAHAGMRWD
jgi:hypothetical protein